MSDTVHRWELKRTEEFCHFTIYTDRCVLPGCSAIRFVVHEHDPDPTYIRQCLRCRELHAGFMFNPPWESVKEVRVRESQR
jgi:hypothetical protein